MTSLDVLDEALAAFLSTFKVAVAELRRGRRVEAGLLLDGLSDLLGSLLSASDPDDGLTRQVADMRRRVDALSASVWRSVAEAPGARA